MEVPEWATQSPDSTPDTVTERGYGVNGLEGVKPLFRSLVEEISEHITSQCLYLRGPRWVAVGHGGIGPSLFHIFFVKHNIAKVWNFRGGARTAHRTACVLSIIVSNMLSGFSGCQGRGGLRSRHATMEASSRGSEAPGSGGGYRTHKCTHNVPMARKNGGKWGKMGGNGGKWGGNGEKWGKMGEKKETWVVQPVPFRPISSPFPPHFPPFSPIFPHFPPFSPIFPWELSPFSPIFPRELSPMRPPHSLVANLNLDFWPFQPLNFPFFHHPI